MRYIDLDTWPRREHFRLFSTFNHPHWGLCANVDLTAFRPFVRQRGLAFTVAWVYLLTRAANAIPEFRQRIRGQQVVEHDLVHPAITVLTDDDLFSFCFFQYVDDFYEFARRAAEEMAYVRTHPTLEDKPGDHWLFMTAIPWVSFTGFEHPMQLHPADSIPRFAWGKFFQEGPRILMPLQVQGHHGLIDGLHVGRFYQRVQDLLNDPRSMMGAV
jgi:chloramphenicol O-acetyltransferase type A